LFGSSLSKESSSSGSSDGGEQTVAIEEYMVNLLCEWAVSTNRTGEHRAIVVAKLLEKYQSDLTSSAERSTGGEYSGGGGTTPAGDDHESIASEMIVGGGTPLFQTLLMKFLDTKAPVLDELQDSSGDNKQSFANLVLLFSQLIHHDVFSHDAYICTLIGRGDLQTAPPSYGGNAFSTTSSVNPYHVDVASIKSEGIKQEIHEEMKMELECQNLDSEFGVFAFKEEIKASPDQGPGSVLLEHPMLSAATPGQALTPAGGHYMTGQALTPAGGPYVGNQALTPAGGSYINSQALTPAGSASYMQGMVRTPGGGALQPLTPRSQRTPGPHTPGTAHTPGGQGTPGGGSGTPGTAHTPGMYHTMVHTPSMAHTPASSSLPAPPLPLPTIDRSALLYKGPSRHLTFATHFPISPSSDLCSHESNQRMVVLYGVGRPRDEARHAVKRATKDISKLFGKKNSIDVCGNGEPGKTKKKKEKEGAPDPVASLENTFGKFRKLSYHDQHAVTNVVARSLSESVASFAAGSSAVLPIIDNVSYLFDLMEYCLNIGQLLELSTQLLKEMPEVETQLSNKSSGLTGLYTTKLCLCIVGILRKYHACLLVSQVSNLQVSVEILYESTTPAYLSHR